MTRLREVALARSGDKGEHANIGVWVHDPAVYETLRMVLTEGRVAEHFAALAPEAVDRYELPNLLAFNFVLRGVLGAGGASADGRPSSARHQNTAASYLKTGWPCSS